ncbi:ATP-dependent nuclease [Glaciibacter superstes]|uniref:ATP-dependent nuclease n=1 Tax=Glaciibacter superstes TaxID=501023 RepID=UPI0003B7770A|nr:ATP-dependent endonuclease [Glaciibacter superstes]
MPPDIAPSIDASRPEAPATPAPLRVSNISVRNFRLLHKVDVALSDSATVLVGRNNTGKTSLAEVMSRFFQKTSFKLALADFSSETYDQFRRACELYLDHNEDAARDALPTITLTINIAYDPKLPEYGPLSALIVDLDLSCNEARVQFDYALEGGRLKEFFEGISLDPTTGALPSTVTVLDAVGDRIPKLFKRTIAAVDPNDSSNTREVTLDAVRKLITVDFLQAQRGLDDEKERPKDLIGQIFQSLFTAASNAEDDTAQRRTADDLAKAVEGIETQLGAQVGRMVAGVIPTLERFGYPGLHDQELETKTKLDIERLLSNYTSVHYRGVAGVSLPESYSGLGSRNLILILLTLLSYYREYAARGNTPGVHLVFVEEPEAHLHPQMQEVFIDQLSSLAKLFPGIDKTSQDWSAQFLVSTHSSHVANKAPFSAIRYFRLARAVTGQQGHHAEVLDLSRAENIDEKFLHQYLTLTRSDLFFADKAILVEGTSERLIVPKAIEKSAAKLSSQYVTLLEVGGAYAHIFFPLFDFLGLPSLTITDIDAVAIQAGGTNRTAARVHSGDRTSNATIKHWFSNKDVTPTELLRDAETDAIRRGNRYIAYQVPEAEVEACGRSFEDAFILANPTLFELALTGDAVADEEAAQAEAEAHKKSDFALRFAINDTDWVTPRYIQRGLDWLLGFSHPENAEVTTEAGGPVVVK